MRLYLDDDTVEVHLIQLLRRAGHDVVIPSDVGHAGENDAVHLRAALLDQRAILTHNYGDFEDLHDLVIDSTGHHFGVLLVRKDNNPARDLTRHGIVRAIAKLLAAGVPVADELIVRNHWR